MLKCVGCVLTRKYLYDTVIYIMHSLHIMCLHCPLYQCCGLRFILSILMVSVCVIVRSCSLFGHFTELSIMGNRLLRYPLCHFLHYVCLCVRVPSVIHILTVLNFVIHYGYF
jgi:hypothetical protein